MVKSDAEPGKPYTENGKNEFFERVDFENLNFIVNGNSRYNNFKPLHNLICTCIKARVFL